MTRRLPIDFLDHFPGGTSIAYSIIPVIRDLPQPFKRDVQVAFAESLGVFWLVLIGVSGIGLLVSLFMKGLPLHTAMDRNWGLEAEAKAKDSPRV